MTLWLVRAGSNGEREQLALQQDLVVIGWDELPSLAPATTREDVRDSMVAAYPDAENGRIVHHTGQVHAFRNRIQKGDFVVLPLKNEPRIAVGEVTGDYEYREDLAQGCRHVRSVKWMRKDIPRGDVDQDLRYSLGAFMTVCQIKRNNAEARILALATGQAPPAPGISEDDDASDDTAPIDLEELGLDQIRDLVQRRFKGHAMEHLVASILRAEGYTVHEHEAGPDGGLDLLAGSGAFGLESPRIAVQVKSGDERISAAQVREFKSVIDDHGADHGLYVAWGDFKDTVHKERQRDFFRVRLWNSHDLIRAIFRAYDHLSEDIRAELPLKRAWIVVPEET